ncbi:MAG: stage III sporulation protein AA [Lachnospiraceae bacterium]|nr:stage III sporulation protein AA [Lachnospiraceae bacterium]
MDEMEQVIRIFPQKLRTLLRQADTRRFQAEELRLRVGQPLLMTAHGAEWYLEENGMRWRRWEDAERNAEGNTEGGMEGKLSENTAGKQRMDTGRRFCYQVTAADIRDTLEYMSRYSLYAFDEELRQGFLTIPGGHRIGVAGQVVVEGKRVKTIQNVSFLNVRVARQIPGCADPILPWVYSDGNICSALIISPPKCGKTTLLRDLIRQVSNGCQYIKGVTVGVVDERSELGACCQGRPQNDLGIRTDVLDGCPKAEGIMMLIRSMAPQVVAVDEIGSLEDLEAIRYGKNCGCKLLATVHGCSLEDIRRKPVLREFAEEGVFERFIILENRGKPGQVKAVFDEEGRQISDGTIN